MPEPPRVGFDGSKDLFAQVGQRVVIGIIQPRIFGFLIKNTGGDQIGKRGRADGKRPVPPPIASLTSINQMGRAPRQPNGGPTAPML